MTTTPSPVLTAGQVDSEVLEPVTSAIVHNALQASLLHNETPEPDSLRELVLEQAALNDKLLRFIERLIASNDAELAFERRAAGWADETVRHLHKQERTVPEHTTLPGRQLAAMLIAHIDTLEDLNAAEHHPHSVIELRRLFAAHTRSDIYRDAVLYFIGKKRRQRLDAEYTRWAQTMAARELSR